MISFHLHGSPLKKVFLIATVKMRTLRHTEFKSGVQYVAKSEPETKTFGFQSLWGQILHSALSVCNVWWKKKVNHKEMSKLGYRTN